MTDEYGTPYYIAPEVIEKNYTEKCDMWSSGVVAYILLTGTPPFDAPNVTEILQKILKCDYSFNDPVWNNISFEAKDFISKLLLMNQKRRLSAR